MEMRPPSPVAEGLPPQAATVRRPEQCALIPTLLLCHKQYRQQDTPSPVTRLCLMSSDAVRFLFLKPDRSFLYR